MGITPITNLTPLSAERAIQADLEPLPMQRVENSPRTGDETYSPSNGPNNGKSARGSADDAAEDDLDDMADGSAEEPANPPDGAGQTGSISFFA